MLLASKRGTLPATGGRFPRAPLSLGDDATLHHFHGRGNIYSYLLRIHTDLHGRRV